MKPTVLQPGERKLTPQEQHCLEVFLADPRGDQTSAYLIAYPKSRAMSKPAQRTAACKLFQRPHVVRDLGRARASRVDTAVNERDRIVNAWREIAYTTLPDIVDYDGVTVTVTEFKKLTPAQRACVKEIRVRPRLRQIEIKLYDRAAALDSLAKAEGMFIDRVEISEAAGAKPEQVIAALLEEATPEEFAVIERMAERLHVRGLKSANA